MKNGGKKKRKKELQPKQIEIREISGHVNRIPE